MVRRRKNTGGGNEFFRTILLSLKFIGEDNGRENDFESQQLVFRKVSSKEEFLAAFGKMNRKDLVRTDTFQACFLKPEAQVVSFGSSFGRERVRRTSHNVVAETGLPVRVTSGR